MTHLEEIEQAITRVDSLKIHLQAQLEILGPLYQARAIERLEATVRAFAVMIQETIQELKDKDEAQQ